MAESLDSSQTLVGWGDSILIKFNFIEASSRKDKLCAKNSSGRGKMVDSFKPTNERASNPGGHWKLYFNDRRPYKAYRIWTSAAGRNGGKDDKIKLHYEPFYKPNLHKLLPLKEELEDFKINHPERLLREYLYRDPQAVVIQKEKRKLACQLGLEDVYKPPSSRKIKEIEVKRHQFMSNNYINFDDGYAYDFNQ